MKDYLESMYRRNSRRKTMYIVMIQRSEDPSSMVCYDSRPSLPFSGLVPPTQAA